MELIKIDKQSINSERIDTVNARELHEFLESKQDFSTWIKARISKGRFAEKIDFICFHKRMEANNAIMIEYHMTMDMSKMIAMMENNEKGDEVRRYFLKMEKIAKSVQAPKTYKEALLQLISEVEKNEKLEAAAVAAQPAIDFHNKIQSSPDSINIAEMANLLTKNGFNTGQNRLYFWMRENGYLTKVDNRPYQIHLNSGLFEVISEDYEDYFGHLRVRQKVLVTGKGQIHFCKLLAPTPKTDNIQMEIANAE